jgi:predicted RNase H-like nuclease
MNPIRTIRSYVGVDACKRGWFAVWHHGAKGWSFDIFDSIADLWRQFNDNATILIDIPIGLPAFTTRSCDQQARRILRQRACCVFPAPCRRALRANTYQEASRINLKRLGAKLSLQTWNICPKIREVDDLLRGHAKARQCFKEAHPEICFWALAGGRIFKTAKRSGRGFAARRLLLNRLLLSADHIVESALESFPRKALARDDILDAMALAVTAMQGNLKTLPPSPPTDTAGLPMEINYSMGPKADGEFGIVPQ